MQRIFFIGLIFLTLWSCQRSVETSLKPVDGKEISWDYADTILKEMQEARIPPDTFLITELNLAEGPQQIQEAVNKVAERGGGSLVLPAGLYYSGPIKLKSKIELHLEANAIIKFIADPALYPLEYTWFSGAACMNFSSMIYARGQSDIKISGHGIIDGQGYDLVWKNMKYNEDADWELLRNLDDENIALERREFGMGHSLRPDLMAFYNSSRIEISGVTMANTPYLMVHPVMSAFITIKNIYIKSRGYNQIGIALESSQNVLIDEVKIEDIAEGIKILSGRSEMPGNQATENILIRNSTFKNIPYTPIIFSSKSYAGARKVFISGLDIESANSGICIYGKDKVRIHDVLIRDVNARNITNALLYMRISRTDDSDPILYNLSFQNIQAKDCGRVFTLLGHPKNSIHNVRIEKSKVNVLKGSFAKYIEELRLDSLEINGKTISGVSDVEGGEMPKLKLDYPEEEVLDSDDIQYNNLPVTVQNTLDENYAYVPVRDIDRIITSSKVIYEISLEKESFQDLELLIQANGDILRKKREIGFHALPGKVLSAFEDYLGTKPIPALLNEIYEVRYRDLTYFEVRGEFDQKLFAIGISSEGNVIEEKQQAINSYFKFK